MGKKIELSPPWFTFVRELRELFKQDKEITISYDDDSKTVRMDITNSEKASALRELLPEEKSFGGVVIKIDILCTYSSSSISETIEKAFKGNPAFKYVCSAEISTNPITYVVFDKKVVQFWNDDLGDPHGVTSMLYEDAARHVFSPGNNLVYSTYCDENFISEENRIKKAKDYYKDHATPDEIKRWEKYNGKNSYESTDGPKRNGKAVEIKNEKDFKKIFKYEE